ncbi:hypothetical protein Q4595_00275 [Wenyingzhuangia sp. 1_MG-2023]|nr:hypothetical protein [Wenyingzhuangia sp. 1_MG-2023]
MTHTAFKNMLWFALLFITQNSIAQYHSENRFFVDANVGSTYRITGEQTASQFHRKTTQTVTTGMQYGITGYYKPTFFKNTRIGLKYLQNRNEGEEYTTLFITENQPAEEGILKNKSQLHYFAISTISSFTFGNEKNKLYFEPSVGYFYFHQEIEIDSKQTLKGGNLGFAATLGYLRKISNRFSLGINFGYLNANLETYTLENDTTQQKVEATPNAAIVLSSFHGGMIMRYKL